MSDNWITNEDDEQITREFRYLKSIDHIGKKYISFLAPKRDEDLTVNFELINGKLMVQSK